MLESERNTSTIRGIGGQVAKRKRDEIEKGEGMRGLWACGINKVLASPTATTLGSHDRSFSTCLYYFHFEGLYYLCWDRNSLMELEHPKDKANKDREGKRERERVKERKRKESRRFSKRELDVFVWFMRNFERRKR
ncbi:hypothetical protein HZH66_004485 [Vespula vulgaris]|uniref:Uncharacterized protein n=1 Tax=Vespula vulgaris TaxID=7454 RepID=A0A834KCQ6_VESVU|nr:hypothetical protein HZH66_004485 [Vespula vulgaris]